MHTKIILALTHNTLLDAYLQFNLVELQEHKDE